MQGRNAIFLYWDDPPDRPLRELNSCLPLKHGSVRRETLAKLVSDNSQHFIFWRRKTCFETSNSRLTPEDGSVRPQTFGKCISGDPLCFVFRRCKKQNRQMLSSDLFYVEK